MGIIAVLAAITITAINPTKQLSTSRDTVRQSDARQLQNAIAQYLIATNALPSGIPATGDSGLMICKQGVTTDTTCLNLDVLAPTYLASIPRDSEETNANYTGYKVSSKNGRATVYPVNMSNTITNGLISYWKFNEGAGTTVADSSGKAHPVTLNGTEAADWSSDSPALARSKGSFNFDDSGDYGIVSPETPLTSTWTISAWVKTPFPATGGWHTLVRGSATDHQVILASDLTLGTYTNGISPGWFASPFNMSTLTNGWHHLVAEGYSGVTVFYVDGKYVGTANSQSTAGPGVYGLGNLQGGGQVFGQFTDVRVYSRVLSTTEIQQIYEGNG
jgi:hypothetical protein